MKNANALKFHLRVYDNYHYMDESEAFNYGEFNTYEGGVYAAKGIVDEFLTNNWKAGMKSGELHALYLLYGEDPVVLPDDHGDLPSFSAKTYVAETIDEFCKKLENQ